MKCFKAAVYREDDRWVVAIPSINGMTHAERLEDAERIAREYIALRLDIPESEFYVELYDAPVT